MTRSSDRGSGILLARTRSNRTCRARRGWSTRRRRQRAQGAVASDLVEINPDAPVLVEGEIEIAAATELVWDVLTTVEDWPKWNTDVSSVEIVGPIEPGTTFRWKAGPGTIKSRIETVERPRVIAWTGRWLGISVIHVWRLDRSGGGTRVQTQESVEGVPARLLPGRHRGVFDRSTRTSLQALKTEAERRSLSPS
jgi:uncharacterized protein YndB with AHSA1/START domain